jgi:hypothetical protein
VVEGRSASARVFSGDPRSLGVRREGDRVLEELKSVQFPLSTADAEGTARLRFADGQLVLELRDHKGVERKVLFAGVVGFKWSLETTGGRQGARDDCVYEVANSGWIEGIRGAGMVRPERRLRHFVIGFNEESSFLEVVCDTVDSPS